MAELTQRAMPPQRQKAILEYLTGNQFARSSTLSDLLGVSEATIRRDLANLERRGDIERTHGGAILTQRMRTEPAFSSSEKAHTAEKQWIGRSAAMLVGSGDTVFVNFGTTTSHVLRQLFRRVDLHNVTIVTNNLSALHTTNIDSLEIILVGGTFREHSFSVTGRFAADVIRQVYANKAIIGVDGISPRYGCTTPVSAEAELSRLMIEHTHGQVIVVADHSKWGVVSSYEIAPLDRIDTIVIDEQLSKKALTILNSQPANVVIASLEQEVEKE